MADASLWSVLLGGALTLSGVVIHDWVQQWHEAKKRRAEKFEELVAAVYEFDHFLASTRQKAIGSSDVPL